MLRVDLQKSFPPGPRSAGFSLDVAFEAAAGVTAVFGPSGAGKTLTMDSIAGFAQPDSGSVHLGDEAFYDSAAGVDQPARLRQCGYLFQSDALFPHLTLAENLAFSGTPRSRVTELLRQFHIDDLGARMPHEVSGGERQRCSIARTLAADPRVLLMDEPGQGLDRLLREELLESIRGLKERLPILLVTHDLSDAFAVADRMIVILSGRILQRGTPEEIYRNPASLDIARLLGMGAEFSGRVVEADDDGRVRIEDANGLRVAATDTVGLAKGADVRVCVRPNAVHATVRNGSLGPMQTPARLQRWTPAAGGVRLLFEGGLAAEVSREQFVAAQEASEWVLEFPPDAARVFPDPQ